MVVPLVDSMADERVVDLAAPRVYLWVDPLVGQLVGSLAVVLADRMVD